MWSFIYIFIAAFLIQQQYDQFFVHVIFMLFIFNISMKSDIIVNNFFCEYIFFNKIAIIKFTPNFTYHIIKAFRASNLCATFCEVFHYKIKMFSNRITYFVGKGNLQIL